MANDNSIVARGLVREFRKGPRAVDGIDLDVAPGEIFGFLGPNGAGKSTTVLMLTTLLPPDGRRCARRWPLDRHRGAEGPRLDRRGAPGGCPRPACSPAATTCGSRRCSRGCRRPSAPRRSTELLERVGLTQAADRRVGGYSGGMKRRLDLALALVHRPRILFLDEPTTGLDPQSRTALWEEVARLAREDGVTVFLTTQYLEEADALADRVGIIDNGKIVAEGTPAALKAEIGRPSIHVHPARQATTTASASSSRASASRSPARRPTSPCVSRGSRPHRRRARARRGRASRSTTSCSRRRRSTTCSWRRPAARSRETARRRGRRTSERPRGPGRRGRPALDHADAASAGERAPAARSSRSR